MLQKNCAGVNGGLSVKRAHTRERGPPSRIAEILNVVFKYDGHFLDDDVLGSSQ